MTNESASRTAKTTAGRASRGARRTVMPAASTASTITAQAEECERAAEEDHADRVARPHTLDERLRERGQCRGDRERRAREADRAERERDPRERGRDDEHVERRHARLERKDPEGHEKQRGLRRVDP